MRKPDPCIYILERHSSSSSTQLLAGSGVFQNILGFIFYLHSAVHVHPQPTGEEDGVGGGNAGSDLPWLAQGILLAAKVENG